MGALWIVVTDYKSRDDHLMAADPRQGSRLPSRALFSGTLFLGAFRFARLCPLFVYDPGSDLFFPSFISPLFLEFLFDFLVLTFSLGTCATRHTITSVLNREQFAWWICRRIANKCVSNPPSIVNSLAPPSGHLRPPRLGPRSSADSEHGHEFPEEVRRSALPIDQT
jgi:hypothetical protein